MYRMLSQERFAAEIDRYIQGDGPYWSRGRHHDQPKTAKNLPDKKVAKQTRSTLHRSRVRQHDT